MSNESSVSVQNKSEEFKSFNFLNLLKHVSSHYSITKMFGDGGQRSDVAIGISTTIAKIALANSNKSSIVGNYLVEDYKLPSGSGLLELANVADVWLFEGAVGIPSHEVLKKSVNDGFISSWVNWKDDGTPLLDDGSCFTPQRLITEVSSIYKLNGQSAPAYLNVKKEELLLGDLAVLDGRTISSKDDMRSKVLSAFFGYTLKEISKFGVPAIPESDRVLASWLFSTSGQQSETVKEGA